ncbi:MAG: VWA domain-containing protein [Bryobacterales bacterium]|nr:VWA domain-containing protein [Bryobacterales bacterium]
MFRLCLFLPWMLASAAVAQEEVVFRSDVALARIDVQVLDSEGRAVPNLEAENFVLLEDGKPKQIRNFSSEDMPVDLLFLIDVSGSMRPHVESLANASQQALRVLGGQDRVAIMVFDRRSRTRMQFRNMSNTVPREFERLLDQEHFDGGTDITQALHESVRYMAKNGRKEARRAIVILTDDRTEFHSDVHGVSRALLRAGTVLSALIAPDAMSYRNSRRSPGQMPRRGGLSLPFPIPGSGGPFPGGGGYPPAGRQANSAGTEEIARESGGDSSSVYAPSALDTTLSRIRQRYSLHYLMEDAATTAGRRLQVFLSPQTRKRHPGAEVRYRRVYLNDDTRGEEPYMITRGSAPAVPADAAIDAPPSAAASAGQTLPRARRRVSEGSGPSRGPNPNVGSAPPGNR